MLGLQRRCFALSTVVLAALSCRKDPPAERPLTPTPSAVEGAADETAAAFVESGREGDDVIMSPPLAGRRASIALETRRILAARVHSQYQHQTRIEEERGVFDVDCSGLVDYVVRGVSPPAWAELTKRTKHARPVARDYHDVIARPAAGSAWTRLARVDELQPGDIIAWLASEDSKTRDTGHVMVVDAPPQRGPRPDERTITVIDSASSGHGKGDTRGAGVNGVGRGNIVLMVSGDGAPLGFRWSTNEKSRAVHVSVALGHVP